MTRATRKPIPAAKPQEPVTPPVVTEEVKQEVPEVKEELENAVEQDSGSEEGTEPDEGSDDKQETTLSVDKADDFELPNAFTKEEGFVKMSDIAIELSVYEDAMGEGQVLTGEEGASWQRSLYQLIRGVLREKDQEVFNNKMNTILRHFHLDAKGAFAENRIFRFAAEWQGSSEEFTVFRRLVTVFIQTANPQTRGAALRDLVMDIALNTLSEEERNRIFSFYNL